MNSGKPTFKIAYLSFNFFMIILLLIGSSDNKKTRAFHAMNELETVELIPTLDINLVNQIQSLLLPSDDCPLPCFGDFTPVSSIYRILKITCKLNYQI